MTSNVVVLKSNLQGYMLGFFLKDKPAYVSHQLIILIKDRKWELPHLAPHWCLQTHDLIQQLQQLLELIILVVKALPKCDGANDIGNCVADFELRVERLSWRQRRRWTLQIVSISAERPLHITHDILTTEPPLRLWPHNPTHCGPYILTYSKSLVNAWEVKVTASI